MTRMHIDSYDFGSMVINGDFYAQDIIVFPDKVNSGWWRKQGHSLDKEDLDEVIKYKPEILVVGKGSPGLMKVPQATKNFLKENQVELIEGSTDSSWQIFNAELKKGKKVVGVFHLTC